MSYLVHNAISDTVRVTGCSFGAATGTPMPTNDNAFNVACYEVRDIDGYVFGQ